MRHTAVQLRDPADSPDPSEPRIGVRNRRLGDAGEDLAAAYLDERGWQILDRNWRSARGEIDIVAVRDGVVAVVEVKTRRTRRFGPAELAATAEKRAKLRELAMEWRSLHPDVNRRWRIRIDVIGILYASSGSSLRHIEAVDA